MIKFFRHIRKSFLEQNKMGKYFKYAIGEIFLVVIGILIALQINNWNENRKAETYEKTILNEIHNTLKEDISFQNALEDRIRAKDTAIDKLILARQKKITLSNEELKRYIRLYDNGIIFSYNIGPYEALKSSGLDKIKNDSLRFALTKYYEVTIPRTKSFIRYDEEEYEDQLKIEDIRMKEEGFYEDLLESAINENGDEGFYTKRKYNIEKYLNDDSFSKVLLLEAKYKTDLWWDIRAIQERTKKLDSLIDKELKTRFSSN